MTVDALRHGAHPLWTRRQRVAQRTLFALSTGPGANQGDVAYMGRRWLDASASESLDLAGGLVDAFGAAATFAQVKVLRLVADRANLNSVIVGGAAANAFAGPFGGATHTLKVPPGGVLLLVAPGATAWAVTADTADILKIANGGAGSGVGYELEILGVTTPPAPDPDPDPDPGEGGGTLDFSDPDNSGNFPAL